MRMRSHVKKRHCPRHWPPTLKQKSHDASVVEEGQVEPNLMRRVAEEPQNAEVVADPEVHSHAERQREASVAWERYRETGGSTGKSNKTYTIN